MPIQNGMNVLIVVGEDEYRASAEVKTVEVSELLDLDSVTDPENATKGWGMSVAHAQVEEVSVTQSGVPDLNQRKGECAPTAAANSLISLVDKNGGEDLISGDPQDFIENLKQYMDWTPENGVPPDDFVRGKNEWAAHAGVPIRTEKVGDTHGVSTIDAIREALERGDSAVELRVKFADAAGTEVVGGHMVTVTGIYQGETGTFLEINDPATPDSGTEQIKIEGNKVIDYGPWQGLTLLSWGFVQTWEGHPTGELLDPMSDEEIQGIKQFVGEAEVVKVIEFRGAHIPVKELFVGPAHPPHDQGEGCPEDHWHANGEVTSVEGRTFTDPNSGGCGFGTLSQNPSIDYTLPPIEE